MDASHLIAMAIVCAPSVHPGTTAAIVATESSSNPFAIGVVKGALERQPATRGEALATISALESAGFDFSVGLAQINRRNFGRLGLTAATALEPCRNLAAMQTVLEECYVRARRAQKSEPVALRSALSCYYSGNFATGFRHGYVARVVNAARRTAL